MQDWRSKMTKLFGCFSLLPTEIRLRIWSFTLDAIEPRVVRANSLRAIEYSGSKNNPTLLHVNREARYKTLQRYKLASTEDYTYIDFGKDTLFVDCHFGLHDTLWTDPHYDPCMKIRALDMALARIRQDVLYKKIKRSPELRELIIVPNLYWHRELISAVTNITFKDIEEENFLKFTRSDI